MAANKNSRAPDEIDIAISERLRKKRKEAGMSLGVLAQAVGVSYQQLQKYETGLNRIPSSRLAKLAAILKVSPAYFFEYEYPNSESLNKEFEENYLLSNFRKIKENDIRKLIMILTNNICNIKLK